MDRPPLALAYPFHFLMKITNPREAAYLAVLSSMKEEKYASDFLEDWRKLSQANALDFHFAQEIAFGSVRMALSLDHVAINLTDKGKLSLKAKEKALLRTALYQHLFMDRVPLFAIVNETVNIAKKHCHQTFVNFLNALLRKLENAGVNIPQGTSVSDLSVKFSYPKFFVEQLINDYGLDETLKILEAENHHSNTQVRVLKKAESFEESVKGLKILTTTPFLVGILENSSQVSTIASSSNHYIQNVTPATLIGKFCQEKAKMKTPKNILDLCAAPGGKLLAAHDFFPHAKLYANDVNESKLRLIQENIDKYHVSAHLTSSRGESFHADEKFDLIILDVPCSNSGVLNKRAEARWRISEDVLIDLEELQLKLIKNAVSMLSAEGTILYMTCSILKRENENLVKKACQLFGLHLTGYQETVLPNVAGWDGGFACALSKI